MVPAGGPPLAGAVNPAVPDGPVVAGGPVGPCETPSPSFYGNLDPLEHSVLAYAGPNGRHVAVGPLDPLRTLSSSDCHPAGPARPYVAGGPVGPDVSFKVLEPLEHSVLDHADPAGQHAAVGTLSPSHCFPAGPAGPCVAGGPVGPEDFLKVLESLEHSVLDHADPAGQHADVQDTVESLEHSVLVTILEGRPMEGITCPELLKHTLLDMTLDGGLVEKISDWEPVAHPIPDATLDGRSMEGTTDPEPLEDSVLVGSMDSGLMEGMSSLEPLEQSVLNTVLVARPMEGITETDPPERWALPMHLDYGQLILELPARPMLDSTRNEVTDTGPSERSALASHLDYGQSNLQSPARPMLDIACDEITDTDTDPSEHSALASHLDYGPLNLESLSRPMVDVRWSPHGGDNCSTSGLVRALGSGLMELLSGSIPLEHSLSDMEMTSWIHDEPLFGSDRGWSYLLREALRIRSAGRVPAGSVNGLIMSPAEDCLCDKERSLDDVSSEGLQRWNMDMDIANQYETFNGLPVYYGGDMYDSEDSEEDDPLELACAAYVEDYNFDVLEGM